MSVILSIEGVSKTYATGVQALQPTDLSINRGEIFALLGPNGAGKTSLIGLVCGTVRLEAGRIIADGADTVRQYRRARAKIGLVPQEVSTDSFETVWATMRFSRGLFGLSRNDAHLEKVLKSLSLWEKREAKIQTLSGGMKRRLMIAKALSHEPSILFLDEPSAGVDVELRRDMWAMVRGLRDSGVTIILTTHYIEEAEELADRIGVINKGRLILVEEKTTLMKRLGGRKLKLHLAQPLASIDPRLADFNLTLEQDGRRLVYAFDSVAEDTGVSRLLRSLEAVGVDYKDLHTEQSSLEDIFVSLVSQIP
ncbi:MAG: ABC transporter ATP-binding protein [Alphaproteobacteria bacterium]|nr:ABC transporter ATP-binding protein [Alphaproteobacteria bacterium]